ncbi:MAG: UDP-N-acetylmuramate--L-alanine ligase, partial [Thermoprotei archaeon]
SKKENVFYIPKKRIVSQLPKILQKGDIIVSLGAGDIGKVLEDGFEKIISRF